MAYLEVRGCLSQYGYNFKNQPYFSIIGLLDAFKDLRNTHRFSLKARPSSSLSLSHAFMLLLLDENGYIQCTIFKFSRVDLKGYYHYPLFFLS